MRWKIWTTIRLVLLEHKDLLLLNEIFKCGDMPFNFGLARNLKSGFGPEDIREEVGR